MGAVTILQLPQATGLTGSEQIEAVQSGTSVKISLSGITALLSPGLVGPEGPSGPPGPTETFPTITPAEIAAGVTPVNFNYPQFNIYRYGAIGDGSSHPLSGIYATLPGAQVFYPSALSLTEEIDYNAINAAINVAKAAGGGTVYLPTGHYMMNNAASPACFLQIPEANRAGLTGTQVNFKGDGHLASVLIWPQDYGVTGSNFAISCGDPTGTVANSLGRYGSTNVYEGFIEDLALMGPSPQITLGTVTANLTGMAWGSRRSMRRVLVSGFYAGLDIVGDWTAFYELFTTGCYYGLYFPTKSNFLAGNLQFLKCFLSGCAMASIALSPNNGYIRGNFIGCYIGSSPYAIMMEAGAGVAGTNIISRFEDCQFESLGNALLCDENGLNAGTKLLELDRCAFAGCFISFLTANKVTTGGRGFHSLFSAHEVDNTYFEQVQGWAAGTDGVLDIDIPNGIKVNSNIQSFLSALTVPILIGANSGRYMYFEDLRNNWSGLALQMGAAATCSAQDYLEWNAGRVQQCTVSVQPAMGVAKSNAIAGQYVVVAMHGSGIVVKGSGTFSGNTWVKKAASGAVQVATGPTDTDAIGYATATNGSSTFTVSLCSRQQIAMI
jgi:hypothetical protein